MTLWGELKRRNVVRVAIAYAVVAWLLIEVAATVFPIVQLPDWTVTFVTMLLLLGFPVALILSWAYELTPDGMKRSGEVPVAASITHSTGRKIDFVIIGVLVLAVVFMFVDNYLPETGAFAGAEIDPESLEPEIDEQPAREIDVGNEDDPLPNSVAVLPFENLSPDPDNAFFAAGIHDTILNELAQLQNLSVIARTSVLGYADGQTPIPEIAEELNVETVMEGSVQYADGRVLVTAQLIDPETNAHLWSDSYNREFADIFAIQADIAMNIANALEAEFSVEEQERIEEIPTESPEAYALYLRANSLALGFAPNVVATNRDNIEPLLLEAIDLDPEFSLAYGVLSYVYATAGEEELTLETAARALELDPQLGLAHIARGFLYRRTHRPKEANEALEQALANNPTNSFLGTMYADSLLPLARGEEGLDVLDRALELDPVNANTHYQGGWFLWHIGDRDRALTAVRRAVALAPEVAVYHRSLGMMEAAAGNRAAAISQLELSRQLSDENCTLAYGYHMTGLHDDAARIAASIGEPANPFAVGRFLCHLALQEEDEAAELLRQWIENPPLQARYFVVAMLNSFDDPVLEKSEFQTLRADLRARVGWVAN